jgi:hypothetical protein
MRSAQGGGGALQAWSTDAVVCRRRHPLSELLKRVFGGEALRCPCGMMTRVIAAITEPAIAKRILECTGLPPRAPPLEPAHSSNAQVEPGLEEYVSVEFDRTPYWDEWSQAT